MTEYDEEREANVQRGIALGFFGGVLGWGAIFAAWRYWWT